MEILAEALASLDGKLELAPDKIPAGATVIAVQLDRDPAKSGRFMTGTDRSWLVSGMALAIKDGHVVRSNCLFGRYTDGKRLLNGSRPKVSACHWVICPDCGQRQLMPPTVWYSKRAAEKRGIKVPDDMLGLQVLRQYGVCPKCAGGSDKEPGVPRAWSIDDEGEKSALTAFSGTVLKAISEAPAGPLPAFLPPTAFKVVGQGTPGSDATLPPEWAWLNAPLLPRGEVAVPYDPALHGSDIVYNPGFWLGLVGGNPDSTGLFWLEGDGSGHRRSRFNPNGVEGL